MIRCWHPLGSSCRALLPRLAVVSLVACQPPPDLGPNAGDARAPDEHDGSVDQEPIPYDATVDAGPPPPSEDVTHLTELTSAVDYAVLQAEGAEVKYLLAVDGREPPSPLDAPCLFQNTRLFPWHVEFVQQFDELEEVDFVAYTDLVMRRETRVWWGGALKAFAAVVHPTTGAPGVIAYSIYHEEREGEFLSVEEYVEIDRRLKECAAYAADLLVLVGDGPGQTAYLRELQPELVARGVAVVFPEDFAVQLGAEGYSLGESYGYLEIVPAGEALPEDVGPRDVVVVENAPNDISVVAGLVTSTPQNLTSHVNLRLGEKGIPNAYWPTVYDNALVTSLNGALVRLVVTETDVVIESARLSAAAAFWATVQPDLPLLSADLGVSELRSFAQISATDAPSYGAKAANLGELHGILSEAHRVAGFGVPFARYVEFIEANGVGPIIDGVLDDPGLRVDAQYQGEQLRSLRRVIRDAPLVPGFLEELRAVAGEVFGADVAMVPLRFRSSTNAEDLDELSGAGLYDSYRGCFADDDDDDVTGPSHCLSEAETAYLQSELGRRQAELSEHPDRTWLHGIIDDLSGDLNDEKPVSRAIRRVWASLWNPRAFEDREYWGIDHRTVYMGVAVNPSFVLEQRETVAVTQLSVDDGDPLYRLVSQVRDVGVVLPDDPSAIAETLTFRRGNGDQVIDPNLVVASSLAVPAGSALWSTSELDTLGPLLFLVHDHFAAQVYPDLPQLSLDVEIELTQDERIVLKQARPFLGAP